MSYTATTNYNLVKPDIGSESDVWGAEVNANADILDALIKTLETRIAVLETTQANLIWQ